MPERTFRRYHYQVRWGVVAILIWIFGIAVWVGRVFSPTLAAIIIVATLVILAVIGAVLAVRRGKPSDSEIGPFVGEFGDWGDFGGGEGGGGNGGG